MVPGNRCDLLLFSYLCKVLDNEFYHTSYKNPLWFAFIFVSLQSLRQRLRGQIGQINSCDLLLFSYLCKVLDNTIKKLVIKIELWFAFIFVSLQSLRQRVGGCSIVDVGCDLLLFSYLCKVLDNITDWYMQVTCVVICFYFRIFAKS